MAFDWRHWDRTTLLVVCLLLATSTGVASVAPSALPSVAGHTAFVTGILFVDVPETPELPPIEYGLATYRDIRFFGLWETERPVEPTQDRMVFVWSASASDPRESPLLQPSGDFARVRDRSGELWTVYEFTYLDGSILRHAYGVRVGDLQHDPDPTVGEDGRYNYVLVYRPDKLLGPPILQKTRVDTATAADPAGQEALTGDLPDEALGLAPDFGSQEGATDANGAPRVAFGLGRLPAALAATDPAIPLPPDVQPLPRR